MSLQILPFPHQLRSLPTKTNQIVHLRNQRHTLTNRPHKSMLKLKQQNRSKKGNQILSKRHSRQSKLSTLGQTSKSQRNSSFQMQVWSSSKLTATSTWSTTLRVNTLAGGPHKPALRRSFQARKISRKTWAKRRFKEICLKTKLKTWTSAENCSASSNWWKKISVMSTSQGHRRPRNLRSSCPCLRCSAMVRAYYKSIGGKATIFRRRSSAKAQCWLPRNSELTVNWGIRDKSLSTSLSLFSKTTTRS